MHVSHEIFFLNPQNTKVFLLFQTSNALPQKRAVEALVSYFFLQMASVPVKTSIGCMEFGRQCPSDQVWCAIVTMFKPVTPWFISR